MDASQAKGERRTIICYFLVSIYLAQWINASSLDNPVEGDDTVATQRDCELMSTGI